MFKKEKIFTKVETEVLELANQNGRIQNPTKEDLREFLNVFFDDSNQFITLTLPAAKNNIRYIQACFVGNDIIVQLGLEIHNSTRLVEKTCSNDEECVDVFYKFFDYGVIDDIKNYQSVEF